MPWTKILYWLSLPFQIAFAVWAAAFIIGMVLFIVVGFIMILIRYTMWGLEFLEAVWQALV